jgi:hypothetical protein
MNNQQLDDVSSDTTSSEPAGITVRTDVQTETAREITVHAWPCLGCGKPGAKEFEFEQGSFWWSPSRTHGISFPDRLEPAEVDEEDMI